MLLVLLVFFALFKKNGRFFRPICQCISHFDVEKKVFVGGDVIVAPHFYRTAPARIAS